MSQYLYHFTDSLNIDSILQYGLLSWHMLDRRGIPYRSSSSKTSKMLDKRIGLQDYVRLCTKKYHPMAWRCIHDGRIQRISWLQIDMSVIYLHDNLFSDDNAVASRSTIGNDKNLALTSTTDQAEVMIQNSLAPRYITLLN
jgi:hypothetical protein